MILKNLAVTAIFLLSLNSAYADCDQDISIVAIQAYNYYNPVQQFSLTPSTARFYVPPYKNWNAPGGIVNSVCVNNQWLALNNSQCIAVYGKDCKTAGISYSQE